MVITFLLVERSTMLLSKEEMGHWEFNPFDPTKYFGFLYCISNLKTNQYYWGKKQFLHLGKKRSKTYGKEMKWRSYTGSSKQLNEDIKRYKKESFTFTIVDLYKTKGGLYYSEAYSQMVSECMTLTKSDGTPFFYNRQIAAIRFIPKEEPTLKTKRYITSLRRKINGTNSKK